MGSVLFRNRYWWYRSLYDEYIAREAKLSLGIASFIWLPHYYWGVHINRMCEVSFAHRNYTHEWGPRRIRLTHSMMFEQFEQILENWQDLEDEYSARGSNMLKQQ
ncbi:hypothetical protein IMG5_138440 [Ichthyophthirius multifiliis]|uniref:Uncharacterized protein n=1 Tax=Ichthyophthirius multifiliis TaxID=5932 RepID=G0QX60_ICHMU|nr:hypothetical protein IMG5_138440 [Ichthyophthirius multifiliis]EGR30191.1 hypothetical protein IMG5_138440 [Ichthyophthirius multifiliis]|eukprot:XP_004031787.1 hypothetical protein IMG5_138440 [Ichthyophthirius multifiliis]